MKVANIETNDKSRFSQKYYSDGSVDVINNVDCVVKAKSFQVINLELNTTVGDNYFLKLQTRSSLTKKGIFTDGSIIDANYRGTISVVLFNMSEEDFELKKGNRYFSLSCYERIPMKFHEITRDTKGSGSSGN